MFHLQNEFMLLPAIALHLNLVKEKRQGFEMFTKKIF